MSRAPATLRLLSLCAVIAIACGRPQAPTDVPPAPVFTRALSANPSGCIEHFDPDTDYFPQKATLASAHLVSVSYHGHYKVLSVTFRGFLDDPSFNSVERYVLVQCGTPPPPLEGALAGAQIVTIPARTVTVTSNEDLGLVLALGLRDALASIGSSSIYDEEVFRRFTAGTLPNTYSFSSTGSMQLEYLIELAPSVILSGAFQAEAALNMLRTRTSGLVTVPTLTRLEPTPLGRTEWLKAVSAIFNKEAAANTLFDAVVANYQRLRRMALQSASRPRAFWATTYASGVWTVARNSWQARLIEDAGGVNVLADHGATYQVGMSPEVLVDLAGDADFWFTENSKLVTPAGHVTIPGSQLGAFRAVRDGQAFHVHRRLRFENSGADYYATGSYRPDLLLADLIVLFHPEIALDHQLFFVAPQVKPALTARATAERAY